MENSFKIRPGQISDAQDIAEIVRALGWFPHFEQESCEQSVERIEQHI